MSYRTSRPWRPHVDLCSREWILHHFLEGTVPVRSPFDLLTYSVPGIPAQVPGNVELDMMRAGEIQDPFLGMNSLALRPYEYHQYWYETMFLTPPFDEPELVFAGLDCIADIWLNGELLGSTDNAMVEHRFSLKGKMAVIGQENKLFVCLKSPENVTRDKELEIWNRGGNRIHIRKPGHCYGWDIMPRIVSAGIWRPVYIEAGLEHEVDDCLIQTEWCSEERAGLRLFYHVKTKEKTLEGMSLRVRGECGDSRFEHSWDLWDFSGNVSLAVERPKRWWPRGYGDASLYNVTVEMLKGDAVLAKRSLRFGIRTIELERTDLNTEECPGKFVFKVNGVPIMAKGSNWVPLDALHSRDAERLPKALELFNEMGCNMIRCWGGNVYEDHDFFDACDENGMLVWQDFGMACAAYPINDAFMDAMRREAEWVVREYRQHPCIALWAGDNENDIALLGWYGRRTDPGRNRLTREVLPSVVERFDSYRAYLPSSPYVAPVIVERGGNQNMGPEQHLWGPRNYFKSDFYAKNTACFASEIGYHGCPAGSSIKKFISEDQVWPWKHNKEWLLHSTDAVLSRGEAASRIELMSRQIVELFGAVPETLEDYALASQIVQAEAKKFFVELFRQKKWRTSGILWWNMLDGWPQMSDAIVDYYFTKKLAFHYLKRIHGEVCVIVGEPQDGRSDIVACNDSRVERQVTLRVVRGMERLVVLDTSFTLPANENLIVGNVEAPQDIQDMFFLEWDADGKRGVNHYLLGRPPFDFGTYRQWLELIRAVEPFEWDWR